MTLRARISQADMERATMAAAKACRASGTSVRIVMDLKNERIEVILGSPGDSEPVQPNEWDDE